jgi:hypothetical protein
MTAAGHVHTAAPPHLTEPLLRVHLRHEHGWRAVDSLKRGYFVTLTAHLREHRKARLAVAS